MTVGGVGRALRRYRALFDGEGDDEYASDVLRYTRFDRISGEVS